MARLTKAQREAMEAAVVAEREAEQAQTYPERLMTMLERATKVNFELTVKDGSFYLDDRDARHTRAVELTLEYSKENQEALHELDWRVDVKEERAREAERRYALKQSALAKLSAEELEVLGL